MVSYRDELIQAFIAHYMALRESIERRVRSRQLATDIVQDCYLRIIEHDPQIRIDNPLAFLHRVASNLIVDRQRHAMVQARRIAAGPLPEETASEAPSPFRVVAGQQEYELLQHAVRRLPDKCRQVFLLYRVRDMTMNQVARELGISPRTVENHLVYAMKRCREALSRAST